jgi:YjbE family integral membrane protein
VENIFTDIAALVQVILIDLALSADNAVAVGLAAAALPEQKRQKAVVWGVGMALVLRIVFGLATVFLLQVRGILLIGGLTLLYIAYRMWADVQKHEKAEAAEAAGGPHVVAQEVTFAHAMFSIVLANVAMSLDNVLAVAGVSRHAPAIMAFGLVLSVVLMGVAASFIAKVVDDHPWIAILGIAVIVLAGVVMIWEDLHHFFPAYLPPLPTWLGGVQEAGLGFSFA